MRAPLVLLCAVLGAGCGRSEKELLQREATSLIGDIRFLDERLAEDNDRLALIQRRSELSGSDWVEEVERRTRESIVSNLKRRQLLLDRLAAISPERIAEASGP